MNRFTFIVNPTSGKGRGERFLKELHSELKNKRVSYEIVLTQGPGHATILARQANTDTVVAVGGDGTIQEVANGLVGSRKTLGIIPAGSGNDFVKSILISTRLGAAVNALLIGRTKWVDVGRVACSDNLSGASNSGNLEPRYFVNGVGIGFDAAVADTMNRIAYLSGKAVYLLAVLKTLGKYRSPLFTTTIDSAPTKSKNLLIAIGNGRCAGGGFYLTPDAVVDDGLLDVCMINEISIPNILRIMPQIMKANHTKHKDVTLARGKNILVSASEPFFVHADGEMVGKNVTEVHVSIKERMLQVITGE